MQYFQHVSRLGNLVRAYGFDLLIVLLAIAAMLQLVFRRGRGGRAEHDALVLRAGGRADGAPARRASAVPLCGCSGVLADRCRRLVRRRAARPVPRSAIFVVGMAASFLLGNLRDARDAWMGLVIVLGGAAIVLYNLPTHSIGQLVFYPLLFGVCWLAGFALHERAEQAEAAEARATQAEREREVAARIAVAEERARIARELHDVVAHSVSVMVLQVGAVRHKLPDALEEDKDALRHVEQTGRTALAEMRRLLGAMRSDGDGVELAPQPGVDGLDSLLERGRRGPVCPSQLHVDGERFPLPRAIDLSAYRIVQEGLTNALKHAHGDPRGRDARVRARGATHRGARRRAREHDERRPRPRPRRRPRAREDLRWRDDRGNAAGRRIRAARAPPDSRERVMTIRVLVADDQSMVRAGFRMLLSGEEDIEVVAEASNGLEAVEKAARFEPTVVLMDIRMPELDGLEATRRILAADAGARILILTTFDLDEYVYEALRAGASGFVLKDEPPEQLIAAIRTVAAGEALLSPSVTKRVIAQFSRISRPAPPRGARGAQRPRAGGLPADRARPLERRDRPGALHQRDDGEDARDAHPLPSSAFATASRPSSSPTRPGSWTRIQFLAATASGAAESQPARPPRSGSGRVAVRRGLGVAISGMHGRRSLGNLGEQMPPRCVSDRCQIGARAVVSPTQNTVADSDASVITASPTERFVARHGLLIRGSEARILRGAYHPSRADCRARGTRGCSSSSA